MKLLFLVLIIICYHDIKTHRISDAFTLTGILIGLIIHPHFLTSLIGVLAGIIVVWLLNSLKVQRLGGGDAKLFAMLGAFTSAQVVLLTVLGAYLLFLPLRFLKKKMAVPYSPFILTSFTGVSIWLNVI